jgi:hypothetical protein
MRMEDSVPSLSTSKPVTLCLRNALRMLHLWRPNQRTCEAESTLMAFDIAYVREVVYADVSWKPSTFCYDSFCRLHNTAVSRKFLLNVQFECSNL